MTESAVLTSLLAAEHAAIYAYGVLGARLDEQTRDVALAAFDGHRQSRSKLALVLRSKGLPAAGPSPSYDVAVVDQLAALRLAIRVETELAVRWRDLMGVSDDTTLRQLAIDGLQDCAVRATRWRRLAKVLPLTEPFPGQVSPR